MDSLEKELRLNIEGDVYFDEVTRHVYSVDASIFEVKPIAVIIPKTKKDLMQVVRIAAQNSIPLTMRGAATGITGGCLGRGLVVDLSRYLNQIVSINIQEEYVICEPGVVQDDLNQALEPFGYRLGPDTSTGNRATLGGMLANNSAGARSLRYGKMSDHVEAVELLLSTGELLRFSSISEDEWKKRNLQNGLEGEIYRTLWKIKERDAEEIKKRFPPIPRRVSGYNLDTLLQSTSINVAKIIAGSEGTFGITTEIRMHIVPKQKKTALLLLFFNDLQEAFKQAHPLLKYNPLSLELIDEQIIQLGRANPSISHAFEWMEENPKALLVVEIEAPTSEELEERVSKLHNHVRSENIGYRQLPILDKTVINHVWSLRKSGLGILLSKRTYSRAIAFIEDISLPPEQLAPFMERFSTYLESKGKQAGIYGHVGSGCMHIRPYINLQDPEELLTIRQIMLDVAALLLDYGGALSGEHGDGWIRSWLNPMMFGEEIMKAFREIKGAFDPLSLMNPGKKIPLTDEWEELRMTPKETLQAPDTFLDFSPEGGFALAADLCNGNGLCRKKEGVMCPSFQATKDEFHSTRARAQSLRAIIHNRLPITEFTGKGLHEVMDLCLSCKGCKGECPSQVDMGKFKSEFLYQYQEKHGYSFRSTLFAYISVLFAVLHPFNRLFNWLREVPLIKKGFEWGGLSLNRSLPSLSKVRFSAWFKSYVQPSNLNRSVVLLSDTFTEYSHPYVGEATVKLFNKLGYRVLLAPYSCCGRPALSKGVLKTARKQGSELIKKLTPFADKGFPIVGLEPSCLLTIRDDYAALIGLGGEEQAQLESVISKFLTLDEFLAQLVDDGDFPQVDEVEEREIKVHGHCYQKAIVGMNPTHKVLQSIRGFKVEAIHSGCCGMAGSFGYEREHEALSMKIGELHLFPAVRGAKTDGWIIASGTSCRQQILDGTGKKALHLAEVLNLAISIKENI